MKVGLYGINLGVLADREAMLRVARTAEAANFESLWTGEHVVFVDPQQPPLYLIHICRCRRYYACRYRWSAAH